MIQVEYDKLLSCPKCNGPQSIIITDRINIDICEAETTCLTCGHTDYWAYGWYESKKEKTNE